MDYSPCVNQHHQVSRPRPEDSVQVSHHKTGLPAWTGRSATLSSNQDELVVPGGHVRSRTPGTMGHVPGEAQQLPAFQVMPAPSRQFSDFTSPGTARTRQWDPPASPSWSDTVTSLLFDLRRTVSVFYQKDSLGRH